VLFFERYAIGSGLGAWMVLSSMYGAAVLSTGTSSKVN